MLNAREIYRNNAVNATSKEQLLIMLLDGAVKFSKIAKLSFKNNDIKGIHENLIKTQDIFYELIASLDLEKAGDFGKNLVGIYFFIISQLTKCNVKKDEKILDETLPLIQEVRDMWNEAYQISRK